jgi:chemotaxis protein histidine kinase CheA
MRALQILKSNAGMAGLTELGDSSHQVEVVVEGLQQKEEVSHAELRELASDVERLQRIIEGISSVVGQMTESQPSELESAPQEAKEAVEADQQIADVLCIAFQDLQRTHQLLCR